jgi:hypothetical protein
VASCVKLLPDAFFDLAIEFLENATPLARVHYHGCCDKGPTKEEEWHDDH